MSVLKFDGQFRGVVDMGEVADLFSYFRLAELIDK